MYTVTQEGGDLSGPEISPGTDYQGRRLGKFNRQQTALCLEPLFGTTNPLSSNKSPSQPNNPFPLGRPVRLIFQELGLELSEILAAEIRHIGLINTPHILAPI